MHTVILSYSIIYALCLALSPSRLGHFLQVYCFSTMQAHKRTSTNIQLVLIYLTVKKCWPQFSLRHKNAKRISLIAPPGQYNMHAFTKTRRVCANIYSFSNERPLCINICSFRNARALLFLIHVRLERNTAVLSPVKECILADMIHSRLIFIQRGSNSDNRCRLTPSGARIDYMPHEHV